MADTGAHLNVLGPKVLEHSSVNRQEELIVVRQFRGDTANQHSGETEAEHIDDIHVVMVF